MLYLQEVCSFLNLIKRLQQNPQFKLTKKSSHENLINNDFIDLENLSAANPGDIDVVIRDVYFYSCNASLSYCMIRICKTHLNIFDPRLKQLM